MMRNFRRTRTPVRLDEVTEPMLRDARAAADGSYTAQTVWASDRYGRQYVTFRELIAHTFAGSDRRPEGAVGDALLTVLPESYLQSMVTAKELHRAGYCACSYGCLWPDLAGPAVAA